MFRIQTPASSSENKHWSSNMLQKKSQQYRKSIRRKHIEQKMKAMREEILASLSEDYHILKNINLKELFHRFMDINECQLADNWKELETLTNDIFIYSRSDQSDHLYFMFDERVIKKLIKLLQIDSIPLYKPNPRTYIRILWILANYTLYSSQNLEQYESIIIKLFRQITTIKDFYSSKTEYKIFTHAQVRQILQIVLFSMNNQARNVSFLMKVCLNQRQQMRFINALIRQLQVLTAFTKEYSIKDTLIPSILSKLLNIFESVLKLQIQEVSIMDRIYEIDFKVVNMLLQLLDILWKADKQPIIQYQITVTLRQFLLNHLFAKPEIILSHNFSILFEMLNSIIEKLDTVSFQITNYNNLLDIEGETKPSIMSLKKKAGELEKRIIQLLQCLIIIFGLNFPEINCDKYYETYEIWVQKKLLRTLYKISQSSFDIFDQIRYKSLEILGNLCLEQQFCQMILDQLPIMNKVFYYIHSDAVGIRLKKSALGVLNSIICIELDGQSNMKMETIELLKNNRIIEIFAKYIGEYVDERLNANLLQSLLLFLNTETAQDAQSHLIWRCFCRENGRQKLEKYHENVQSREIQSLIENILETYRS